MHYPIELKNQAIEMAIEGNKSVAQVAHDLDIKVNTLYNWVDQHQEVTQISSHPKIKIHNLSILRVKTNG